MDLRLTVVDTAAGSTADLHVTAPDASPAGPVLAALRTAAGVATDATLAIAGQPVPADGTVADCGLLEGAVVTAGPARGPHGAGRMTLVTTAGPDAGRRHALIAGRQLLGRLDGCDITVPDRSISRQHLALDVAGDSLTVTHVGRSTPTLLDGTPLPAGEPQPVIAGSVLRLGDSALRVERPAPTIADGNPVVHRSPRLRPTVPDVEIVIPPPPVPGVRSRPSMIAAIAPLVGGLVLSLVLHQWQFLLFTALSPVMVLGQAASDRLSTRRADRVARRGHAAATACAHERISTALEAERRRRHDEAPNLADVVDTAARRQPSLWQRAASDADALTVRLGLGDVASDVRVVGGGSQPRVCDVPVCLRLPEVGVLGICGPPALRSALVRSLVLQAAVQVGPADLKIVGVVPQRAGDWGWLRWLPHTRSGDATSNALLGLDDSQATRRIAEWSGAGAAGPAVLIVVEGTEELRGFPGTGQLLAERPAGRSVVWCASQPGDLPAECAAVISITDEPRPRLRLTGPGSTNVDEVVPDLLAVDVAECAARCLAPARAAARRDGDAIPRLVRWADVVGLDLRDRDSAIRSLLSCWEQPPSTVVTLGADAHGAVTIDVYADGPHALVAGTTGSGKSELLVSLVASLAARHRPDQLALLLIDQKGGAALGPCSRLPHAIGLVTDLDGPSTRRALLCLGSELRRRESILAAARAADLATYRAGPQPPEPLGRLVIVVDEFAALAHEHPDFITGLVGIAQRGRSLGVHLVLATQRPEGVVSADIRANTRLRICLGVAREQESRDVIDSAAAAAISRTNPGRAYLRIGPGDLRAFQAARITAARTTEAGIVVTHEPVQTLGDPPLSTPDATHADADLDVFIDAAISASAALGCTAAAAPWLPPLPPQLPLSALPPSTVADAVAWGLVDLPEQGEQPPLTVDPTTGRTCLVVGAPRSGRTTAAVAWATSLAAAIPPEQLQMWAIDGASGLASLGALPHCGGVVPARDRDRVALLIGFLSEEVEHRRARPATSGPALVLVVDSWEALVSQLDDRDAMSMVDRLARLAADGPAAGLQLMLTGDRGLLAGRIGGLATQRLVLRLADPTDFLLIGLAPRDVPRQLPPGRGLRADDGALVQIATPDAETASRALGWPAPRAAVKRFAALPDRVGWSALRARQPLRSDQLVLGLEADGLSPLVVGRAEIGGPFLVGGPPGSGRSTALLLLARQWGPGYAVCCSSESPLAAAPAAVVLPATDPEHAADLLGALCAGPGRPPAVLVDDADLLPDSRLVGVLERLVADARRGGPIVALASTIDAAASAFRGPLSLARRARTGLLLWPGDPHDGEVLGLRLPRGRPGAEPPGRGWLVTAGASRRVQLADPYDATAQPSTEFELSALGARNRE
jgi:S-DNA-T family DNA segregation ATPase FtsK/SpoIIIE